MEMVVGSEVPVAECEGVREACCLCEMKRKDN